MSTCTPGVAVGYVGLDLDQLGPPEWANSHESDPYAATCEGDAIVITPTLELWFANQDGLVDYLQVASREHHQYLPAPSDGGRDAGAKQHALTRMLEQRLMSTPVPELQRSLLGAPPIVGTVVSIEQAFYFRKDAKSGLIRLHGDLNTTPDWKVIGSVDSARFAFSSTADRLRKRRHVFMVATVLDVSAGLIEVRPLFVGLRRWSDAQREDLEPRRVYPQQVDQFDRVDWRRRVTPEAMTAMHAMAEADVKSALARIVGTDFVDRDWGGERSDLVTNNLLVRGKQTSAAWLLKGRSVQGPMRIPHLGKNGDQVERLASEPAELLVVQHNHQITSAVTNLLTAFAYDLRNPRRFMTLDGEHTAMILRDFDELK